jgi:riboflavin synthase
MFTGIIQEVGTIRQTRRVGDGLGIQVTAPKSSRALKQGDSINISGACQTATTIGDDWFEVFAMVETLSRTNFAVLEAGAKVNLELPLSLKDPIGGHLVSGHVDCIGKITLIKAGPQSRVITIAYESGFEKYLIERGSVAVDGISLTVFDVAKSSFAVSLIPETLERTNFKFRQVGDQVNLEFDQIGKYIEKICGTDKEKLTMDFLHKHGFVR